MRTCLQGSDLATSDKERGPGALKMRQPPFISDIPSAGMVPPQVCAPLCNAPARQQRSHHFLLEHASPSESLCCCRSSYSCCAQDMLLPVQPALACTGRGSSAARQLDDIALVALQVEASLLWNFQALLEHSGEVAGLHGAVLSISGVLYTLCSSPNSQGWHFASPGGSMSSLGHLRQALACHAASMLSR